MLNPTLSVVIPVYNEEQNIRKIIELIQQVSIEKEIVVVDDKSTDRTLEILENDILPIAGNVRLYKHQVNQGKGSALRTGFKEVKGEVILIQDADLEYDPNDYLALVTPIINGEAEVVYGSRFLKVNKCLFVWHWFLNHFFGRHYEIRYLHHFLGIQVLNAVANLLYGARITDEATCYKVFKKSVLDRITLKCTGFEFCPEFTAKVRKKGYKIVEFPIQYHPRSKKEGKKLSWTHGFEAIWTLIKYRFID